MRRAARLVTALLAAGLAASMLAGCASVPDSSPVQVLRKVTEGDDRGLPPGPMDNSTPLDIVRGFVNASGNNADQHAAARRFLAPAGNWDDGASLTVIDEQFDTVYARRPPNSDVDRVAVRVRGTQVGRLTAAGAFELDEKPIDYELRLVRRNDGWRIDAALGGVSVRLSDFRANYRSVKTYFVDPSRQVPIADLRYLPANPARTLPSRAVEQLLAGPSAALAGAVSSTIPRTARLRANVAETPDGAVLVDLTELGDMDEGRRRLLAAQVVLSLAEVNVSRVRLLDDGAPLLADRIDLSRDVFADMGADPESRPDVPGVVVSGGRARALLPGSIGEPLPGPVGSGAYDLVSASTTSDGQRLAAVTRSQGRLLLIGRTGAPLQPTGLRAEAMTRPSWTPNGGEVWTVLDGARLTRVALDASGRPTVRPVDGSALSALGPIADLRLSSDGMRVAAVVGGQLAVGAVTRSAGDDVAVRNVRMLRASELTDLVALSWRTSDQIAAVGRRPDRPVEVVMVDGLDWQSLPTNNLTPPLTAVAAAPGRPLMVTDQNGVWSFGADDLGSWRQLVGGAAGSVAGYPG
ncbi:MAG: LpqB family beta-propeller domain-containing protein [Actinomycetota bacterium]|nr:LpqB family beta-propeller domain-containing protein [Actinomycetota bacterium]